MNITRRGIPANSTEVAYSIALQINEIILYGFNPADRLLIQEGARQELERLFRETPLPSGLKKGGQIARMTTSPFEFETGTPGWQIGIEIAGALFKGFSS